MPCRSDYMEPSARERESKKVLDLLREVGIPTGKYDRYYGRPETLDEDTRTLCDWCREHRDQVKDYSLELQIWWRDHQRADAARELRERAAQEKKEIIERALSKLSSEERRALGL